MAESDYPEGATPLDLSELEGLRLPHITDRGQLDRWEQQNIIEAIEWTEKKNLKAILTEIFIKKLHFQMFGNVWAWAGQFRLTDKNIGVPSYEIAPRLKLLLDDVEFWIQNGRSSDEIAVTFHHRLVSIHPFSNGNGRHARLMTDLILEKVLDAPRFTWGSKNLSSAGETRQAYIDALRAADNNDYTPLTKFVLS